MGVERMRMRKRDEWVGGERASAQCQCKCEK